MNEFNEYVRERFSAAELRYPYEGSKTQMYVFDRFEDADLIAELLEGMYAELPESKPPKAKCD